MFKTLMFFVLLALVPRPVLSQGRLYLFRNGAFLFFLSVFSYETAPSAPKAPFRFSTKKKRKRERERTKKNRTPKTPFLNKKLIKKNRPCDKTDLVTESIQTVKLNGWCLPSIPKVLAWSWSKSFVCLMFLHYHAQKNIGFFKDAHDHD